MPPTKVSITARDYDFNAPDTIPGGLVELSFTNAGKEAHFAGLARVAAGKTFEEVEAALTAPPPSAPPPGPPPFEEIAGTPTTDPGRAAKLTVNPTLKAGTNVVRLRNEGRQLHEINLVELGPGKTVDDVVEWYRRPAGRPWLPWAGWRCARARRGQRRWS